jgi:hypothetical protein
VQWDHGGDILPYPTGVLNRFYIALDPTAAAAAAAQDVPNESLSLSLIEEEPSEAPSALASPIATLQSPSSSSDYAVGKRKGATLLPGCASPTKKPAASARQGSREKKERKKPDKTAAASTEQPPEDAAQVLEMMAEEEEEEEEEEGDTSGVSDTIVLLIDGKWKKVALVPRGNSNEQASVHSALIAAADLFFLLVPSQSKGKDDVVEAQIEAHMKEGGEEEEEEEEEEEMSEEAVEKDASSFMSFLEQAMSSSIYVASLAHVSLCLPPSLPLSHSLTLSLTHSHTHTLSLSLYFSDSLSSSRFSLSRTPSECLSLYISIHRSINIVCGLALLVYEALSYWCMRP